MSPQQNEAHLHHAGCGCGGWTRRGVFAGLCLAGAAAMFSRNLQAQASQLLIDTHHHFYPPAYLKAWNGWDDARRLPHFSAHATWTPQKSIEEMDKVGIKTAILSLASTPGTWFDVSAQDASRLARDCNDYGAAMVKDFPGRFGLFATLSMIDIDATLKEIEHAFDTLKADGVGLQSSYADKWLGDPQFKPVIDELNRRKAVAYVHPVAGACCTNLTVGANAAALEVPFDTTRAATSLLLSGSLARARDIKWLFSHAGGTIPMMAGRLNAFYANHPKRAEFAPEGIEAEFRKLFYDTANAAFAPNMTALMKLVPASQITFGTDYPYFRLDQAEQLKALGLPDADLKAILSGNAQGLVPRLKA